MLNNQSKQLAHGAMMIAIFAVLFAITLYVPVVSLVTVAFAPLPVAWYSVHYNNSASISVVVACMFISLLVGGLIAIPAALLLALVGFAIGSSIRNNKTKLHMLITTSMSTLIGITFMYVFLVQLFDINFIKDGLKNLKDSYLLVLENSEQLTGSAPITVEQLNQAFELLEAIIPATIIVSAALMAFIFISISLPLLKRLKVNVPKFNKFSSMRLPKAVLWYYLIVLVVSIFVNPEPNTTFYMIVANFTFILWILLTIQGVSFLHFVIEEKKYPKFLKVVAAVLAFPFYNFILLIGVFDLGFDIRKYIFEKKKS